MQDQPQLKPGDVVDWLGRGPRMTVHALSGRIAHCTWRAANGQLNIYAFGCEELVPVGGEECKAAGDESSSI